MFSKVSYLLISLLFNFGIWGGVPLFTSENLNSGHSTQPSTKGTQCFSFCHNRNFPVQPQSLRTLPFFIVCSIDRLPV